MGGRAQGKVFFSWICASFQVQKCLPPLIYQPFFQEDMCELGSDHIRHLSTDVKTHLFTEHNWNILVALHLCLCATRLDALEWRCLYFPSGHNKQATKFDMRSNVLWKSISGLGSGMNKDVWIIDMWIIRLTALLLVFVSPAGRSWCCFANEDLRGFHSPHWRSPETFSKLPGGYQ